MLTYFTGFNFSKLLFIYKEYEELIYLKLDGWHLEALP